jgi:hypothetical protein
MNYSQVFEITTVMYRVAIRIISLLYGCGLRTGSCDKAFDRRQRHLPSWLSKTLKFETDLLEAFVRENYERSEPPSEIFGRTAVWH